MKIKLCDIQAHKIIAREREFKCIAQQLHVNGYYYGSLKIRELIQDVNELSRHDNLEELRDFIEIAEQYVMGEITQYTFDKLYLNCVANWTDGDGEVSFKSVRVSIQRASATCDTYIIDLPILIAVPMNQLRFEEDKIASMLCALYRYSDDEVFVAAIL